VARIYETSEKEQLNHISIIAWAKAMIRYMKETDKGYKEVHRMGTYDLMKDVEKYID